MPEFEASQPLQTLKLRNSSTRTIEFFGSFFCEGYDLSEEFRCAFKQDQVDFLLKKIFGSGGF